MRNSTLLCCCESRNLTAVLSPYLLPTTLWEARRINLLRPTSISWRDQNSERKFSEPVPVHKSAGSKWIDSLGFFAVFFSLFAVCLHWTLVFLANRFSDSLDTGNVASRRTSQKVWHWVHGLLLTFLGVTGLQLRFPALFPIFADLASAVDLHNFAGVLLSLDYLFWFVYRIRRKNLGIIS